MGDFNGSDHSGPALPEVAMGEVVSKINDLAEAFRAPMLGCFRDGPTGPMYRLGYEEEARAATLVLTLTRQYLQEMGRCHQSGAQFAATVMGCSALEALLMLNCLGFKDTVVTSATWHKHASKKKTFVQNVSHADLDLLIKLAIELGWFPQGLNSAIIESLPELNLKALDEVLRTSNFGTWLSPVIAKTIRNYLHPGRCLRGNVHIEEPSGQVGLAMVLLAILAYMSQQWA